MATPGVFITTDVRSGPPAATAPSGAALIVVGECQYGSVVKPTICTSMADFDLYLGGRFGAGYVYDTAKTFFEEGGARLIVQRAWASTGYPGTPAITSKITFACSGTAGNTTVTLEAKYLGSWGDSVVAAYTTSPNKLVFSGLPGNRTETFNFTGSTVTATDMIAAINSTISGSSWVTASLTGTAPAGGSTVTQATVTLTAATGIVAMTKTLINAYVDPTASATQYITEDYGTGMICVPGFGISSATSGSDDGYLLWYTIIKHCVRYNRIAALAYSDSAVSVTNAVAWRAAFVTYLGTKTDIPLTTKGLDYAQLVMPWLTTSDGVGGTRTTPPEGFVGAARARAHAAEGPHRAGAGAISSALYVTSPNATFSSAELDTLALNDINPLRVIAGSTRVYGCHSLSTDDVNWNFITYRDTVNYVAYEALTRLEPFAFNTIDNKKMIFSKIRGALIGFLETMRMSGSLYELYDSSDNLIDPGYSVDVSEGINPPANLANGIITAKIGVRVSPVGERINLTITKAALTSSL
jgi:hypothetical protein